MVELLTEKDTVTLKESENFLKEGEVVVIVDDSDIPHPLLEQYLSGLHIQCVRAKSRDDVCHALAHHNVAIVLLDIELPGKPGTEILAEIAPANPHLGIIMVTDNTDIQMALDCLHNGADDYITKPVSPNQFHNTIHRVLKKRHLSIQNSMFQKKLEHTNAKMQFLHNLTLKMNSAYLNTQELDNLLLAILTGITSEEGLGFNRALLALYDNTGMLCGKSAIGPSSIEEAGAVWKDLKQKRLGLHELLTKIPSQRAIYDNELSRITKTIAVPASEEDSLLIRSSLSKKSIYVSETHPMVDSLPHQLVHRLQLNDFLIVPLFSPGKSLGVIIADNFVTKKRISNDDIIALEIFANHASLAIEHNQLYKDMAEKIYELEQVTEELEKNKNMLLEAERYATIGQFSAQLVHAIRNPVTSIGGSARHLLKKTVDKNLQNYLDVIAKESAKIEEAVNNLFAYAENIALEKQPTSLSNLLKDSLLSFLPALKKKHITVNEAISPAVTLTIDKKTIRQVFLHILRNSLEAMEEHGTLTVILQEFSENIMVEITDTGDGIKAKDRNLVNDSFYTTTTYGSSLGLSLVKQILDLHGASLSIEQNKSSGTTVSVFFIK